MVRRQLLHYEKLRLPDDVEIIFVDDGSEPPLTAKTSIKNFKILYTNDKRMWTQPAARNFGVRHAKGEYILVTDIDHILSLNLINAVYSRKWDVVRFKREVAVLDANGDFTQDENAILSYGFLKDRLMRRGLKLVPHTNSFGMRRDLYWQIGGVSEKRVGMEIHPHQEEQPVKKAYKKLAKEGKIKVCSDEERPTIYMIPNGRYCGDKDYNPFGLFHNLKRKTR